MSSDGCEGYRLGVSAAAAASWELAVETEWSSHVRICDILWLFHCSPALLSDFNV